MIFKDWLIHKLGGITRFECEQCAKAAREVAKQAENKIVPIYQYANPVYTVKTTKIIPEADGDYEIYMRQEISENLGQELLKLGFIHWELTPLDDGPEQKLTAQVRVEAPTWET